MNHRAPWRYTHQVCDERHDYLLGAADFPSIVADLMRDFVVAHPRVEQASAPRLRQRGCWRVECRLVPVAKKASKTADQFFNSPTGYRAQFYIDASNGDEVSSEMFATLLRGPLNELAAGAIDNQPATLIARSLKAAPAKVWIPKAEWPTPGIDIDAPKWVAAQEGRTDLPIPEARALAFLGTRAPIPSCFEIMGAWLDRDGNVFVDPEKADRSHRISAFGWV